MRLFCSPQWLWVITLPKPVGDSSKIRAEWRTTAIQSTESQIFDASFWSENGVSWSRERNKIGDSVLCCYNAKRIALTLVVCVFCMPVSWTFDKRQSQPESISINALNGNLLIWRTISSVGRASVLWAEGRGFETLIVHMCTCVLFGNVFEVSMKLVTWLWSHMLPKIPTFAPRL